MYHTCAALHQQFLDTFGRELQPRAKKRKGKGTQRQSRSREGVHHDPPKVCPQCYEQESMMDDHQEGDYVCTRCGFVQRYGIAHGVKGLSVAQTKALPPRRYQYQPDKHFERILMQVQGILTRKVPDQILQRLRMEVQKLNGSCQKLTPDHVRRLLRKLRYSQYYGETVWLTRQLNRRFHPVVIEEPHQESLRRLFHSLRQHFPKVIRELHLPRRNFVAYHTTARLMCLYFGYHDYMDCFASLKSWKKQQTQVRILEKMFEKLDRN